MAVAFDTLKLARGLRENASMSAAQAEGVAEAFSSATTDQLATKPDLAAFGAELRAEIGGVKAEVLPMKWMLGFNLALTVAVLFMRIKH